jgi:hypothetical protein
MRHRGFLQILSIRDEGGFLKASLVLMANPVCPRTPLATTGDISVAGTDVKRGVN